MKHTILSLLAFIGLTFSSFGYFDENPAVRIYTDNVENSFEVGEQAVFFAEVLTDFQYHSGNAEIVVEAEIVGFPLIKLKATKISETYYSFVSTELKESDIGRRYIQVQLKTRPKKEAERIRRAIKANGEMIIEEIIKRDDATSEEMREYHQLQVEKISVLNESLFDQLEKMLVPVGGPSELSFYVEASI